MIRSASDITSNFTSTARFSTSERCSQILRSSLRLSRSVHRKSHTLTTITTTPADSGSMRENAMDRADSIDKAPPTEVTEQPQQHQSNFVRQSFATASLTRPMCRICHDCSGYTGPPILTLPASCNVSSISLSSSSSSSTLNPSGQPFGKLISPCLCDGSLKYIHEVCLQQWITVSHSKQCELCHYEYEMRSFTQQFCKWKNLPLMTMERRRLMCSVVFHILAIVCVIWSLYVLIERIIDEVIHRKMSWQFWTKIIVVAVGLTGGLVFSYVQCRLYYELIIRWRDRNRVFVVQVPSEELLKNARSKRLAASTTTHPPPPSHPPRQRRDRQGGGLEMPETATTITVMPGNHETLPTTAMP